MICNGCGGVVGRDCYNPRECEQITHSQEHSLMIELQQLNHENARLKARIAELEKDVGAIE